MTPAQVMPEPYRRHLVWLLLFRTIVTFLLMVGMVFYHRRVWGGGSEALLWLAGLFAVSFLQTLISLILLPRTNRLIDFTRIQVCCDLLLVVALIYLTGALESPYPFLFLVVIITSAFFLPRREVFICAAAASVLYGGLLDLHYYRYLPRLRGVPLQVDIDGNSVLYALYIHVTAFLLIAFLSGLLAERLRRSELARERTVIDFHELESLNSAIQAHISSGLMIVNPLGRIRTFNREAERITGYRLGEIYDRMAVEYFPLFAQPASADSQGKGRAEGLIKRRDGAERIVGYNVTAVYNAEGGLLGQLVNFQDLTRFKVMEEQIKRSERLASIGRLASGLAHEIRNPLASISGSVQLLLEQDRFGSEDRQLMGIVVREADRLSTLLSEFLGYARPIPPKRQDVDVAALVAELIRMATADPRFSRIQFECQGLEALRLWVDPQQLRQVLWNLVVNAGDALPDGGTVLLAAAEGGLGLVVEDDGQGVPKEVREKIFDPFFTTKDRGTGLGLATVYAIMEAHGGSVRIEDGHLSGARFVLDFPSRPTEGNKQALI